MLKLRAIRLRRGLALALLAALLAACGQPDTGSVPTLRPTAPSTQPPAPQPPATARPTVGATVLPLPATATPLPAQPTAATYPTPAGQAPTAAPPVPTMAPAQQPIIGFNPKGGPAGTRVDVFGSGYAPGQAVAVRLGLPSATGEVLASAFAGSDGRWAASLVIPDRLPSGELITGANMFLVAMGDRNQALASAPFGFVPPPAAPPRAEGQNAVANLLSSWQRGRDVRPYMAARLRAQYDAGRPADQLLGLHPIALNGFAADTFWDGPDGSLQVTFFLDYGTFTELRTFTMVPEGGRWLAAGSALDQPQPQPQPQLPADALDAVYRFLQESQADRTMRTASFYLGGRLRELVQSGQIADVGGVLMEQNPFQSFSVDRIVSSDQDMMFVQATLYYGPGSGSQRIFQVSTRDGGFWRVFKVALPVEEPTPVPPTLQPYPAP